MCSGSAETQIRMSLSYRMQLLSDDMFVFLECVLPYIILSDFVGSGLR